MDDVVDVVDDVVKGSSGAGSGNTTYDNGKQVSDNFGIDDAYVKPKHLETSGGNGAKFIGDSKNTAEQILKDALGDGNVVNIIDDGISAMGNQKYEITIDAGKVIGTKGETFIKIILSDDGGMLSAFPVKQ